MEEALYETTILRQFAGLNLERIPDETTILNFRRLLEKHELAGGILAVINGYLGDRGLSLRQGCGFHGHPATHSMSIWPPIPR
jgi:IS5 family transposase